MAKGEKIIIALDVNSIQEVENLVDRLRSVVKIFKIGSELFTACGMQAIDVIRRKGCRVFLDLKFHDIPNTVEKASRAAARQGVHMFTVHAMGGAEMMKRAKAASEEEAARLRMPAPLVFGVTVLTSLGEAEMQSIGLKDGISEQVIRLAKLAQKAGLDGAIVSPEELELVRKSVKNDFLLVAPGIRPAGSQKNDQQRTATPKEAVDMGADYIVIGRPITQQADPKDAAEKIINEMA